MQETQPNQALRAELGKEKDLKTMPEQELVTELKRVDNLLGECTSENAVNIIKEICKRINAVKAELARRT